MSEESKAIQEIAKTTGKGIEAAEKLGAFLSKVTGEGIAHLGNAFSDWARLYRYTNLLKLIDKIEQIHAQRKIQGKTILVAPKYLVPLLEQASLEDDDLVADMWAGLIANSTDPGRHFELRKLYIDILSKLDPIDARILQFLSLQPHHNWPVNYTESGKMNADRISNELQIELDDCLTSLSNLARNSLLKDGWEQTIESLDFGYAGFSVDNPNSNFSLSHLGKKLVDGSVVT